MTKQSVRGITPRKRAPILVAALLVAATAVIGVVWLGREPATERPSLDPSAKAPGPSPMLNSSLIAEHPDARVVRDFTFKEADAGFRAEGVELGAPGELTLRSQISGGTLEQRLGAARLVKGGAVVEELARAEAPSAEATVSASAGSVRYRGFYEDIDLEYRYDGKDVEELFHLGETLQADLARDRADLRVEAIITGIDRDHAVLTGAGRLPLLPVGGGSLEAGVAPDSVATQDAVELAVAGGHTFILPAAVALDQGGARQKLDRTFTWTGSGLEVAVLLPSSFVERARGQVTIDPSVVDTGRSVETYAYGPPTIVRDSQGGLHVAYRALVDGVWKIVYSNGDGTSWMSPRVVDELFDEGEDRVYDPTLAIDRADTLHIMWADYGDNAAARGVGGWRHRVHYARCPARCRPGTDWTYEGRVGGHIIAPGTYAHAYYRTMAVDSSDVLHFVFWDWSITRYFQMSPAGVVTEKANVSGISYYDSTLVVDNDNAVHLLQTDYDRTFDVAHHVYDPGTNTWLERPGFQILAGGGGNGGVMRNYRPMAVVDQGNNIHMTLNLHDSWWTGTWRVGYGRFNVATQGWEDVGVVHVPNQGPEEWPSLTVDDAGTVHLFWTRQSSPAQVMYTTLPAGGSWGAPVSLASPTVRHCYPQARPRLAWPLGPNRSVPADQPELIFTYRGDQVRYAMLGVFVESPVPVAPADGAFVNNPTPTFQWARIMGDDGSNTNYSLQFDSRPTFDVSPTTIDAGTNDNYTLSGTAPELFADGSYHYWRVRAADARGNGPYGIVYEVATDTTPPAAFDLVDPVDGATPATLQPTFVWQPSNDPG